MTTSVQQMREYLKKHYHYALTWTAKVDRMSDKQVIAIYYRILNAPRR